MDRSVFRNRIEALRQRMREHGIDVYLVLTDDFHASEYVDEYFKCRAWLSGFTGSAGTLVVTGTEANLWVDSRYYLQAKEQLAGTGVQMQKQDLPQSTSYVAYLRAIMSPGQCLGYDGRTVSAGLARNLKKTLAVREVTFREDVDLVGEIWEDRPAFPSSRIWELSDDYTGESRADRLKRIRDCLTKWKADYLLLSKLDDIAWLYLLRGNDIRYTPVFMAYSIISREEAILYVAPEAVGEKEREALKKDRITLRPYLQVYEDLRELPAGRKLWVNEESANVALMGAVPRSVKVINRQSPTTTFMARKTPVEMENERRAHIQDGVAVTKLLYWLKQIHDTDEFRRGEITELTVMDRYLELRRARPDFVDLSFEPIVGSGPHGAVVHYISTPDTDIPVQDNTFLLMDTGGHYLRGTTDITRTAAVGELTHDMKVHYTAVLRGNLNLSNARFSRGETGAHLDALAKVPLWELGMDYGHGTGHGVGYLLSVHEGPQSIRPRSVSGRIGAALEEGMLTSVEPGVYLEGRYGIRLENLVLCVKDLENEFGQFLRFETVTMVPFEREAILPDMLSPREAAMLDEYHATVYRQLSPWLTPEERQWLAEQTAPIGADREEIHSYIQQQREADGRRKMIYTENETEIRRQTEEIRRRLQARDPKEISDRARVGYDPGAKVFFFLSLGKEVLINVPEYEVRGEADPGRTLTYLQILDMADGEKLTGEELSVSELFEDPVPAGEMDRRMEETFDRLFAGRSAEAVRKACRKLGAAFYESDADVTATICYTPVLPLTVYFWEETEEYMASGDIQCDESALHCLTKEEICRAGMILVERIAELTE